MLSAEQKKARDEFVLLRRMVERVEEALEPGPEPGQFVLWADDVQQLGWMRVVCDMALERSLAGGTCNSRRDAAEPFRSGSNDPHCQASADA